MARVRGRWLIVTAVVGAAAIAGPATMAFADSAIEPRTGCGGSVSADVPGGLAHWEASCSSGKITVSGWVKDVRTDGKCARVKAFIDDKWEYSGKACPSGDKDKFKLKGSGVDAKVYLYTY